MPSIDPWQHTQKSDALALESFLCAHWFRHQTYCYAASRQGVSLTTYNFSGHPDDAWFAQHASAHQALQPFMVPDQTVDLTVLSNAWQDDEGFDSWMQMHTLIHQRLDQYFGLF